MTEQSSINRHTSLTEWFERIGSLRSSSALRNEDNTRMDRLKAVSSVIAIPIEAPLIFPARELWELSQAVQELLQARADDPCAIRLIPHDSTLPKLRNRGLPLQQCYTEWLLRQSIDPDQYTAEIYRHGTQRYGATWVVTAEGIFGEAIRGFHHQLSRGETEQPTMQFLYDFKIWQWSRADNELQKFIQTVIAAIAIDDSAKQQLLHDQINAAFYHNYIGGYWEAVQWESGEIYFIDYNRILSGYFSSIPPAAVGRKLAASGYLVTGRTAYPGTASGRAVIIDLDTATNPDFRKGDILVCDNTDVRYLEFMILAGAIVTNRGGILSHAAIVARELKKPCIIGTSDATQVLASGDMVTVQADRGIVTKLHNGL